MSLKLTYFQDGKGRNELTRLIFAVGGVDYQDELIGPVQYQTLRDNGTLPWGQLPILTITKDDGREEVHGQSCAIARHAAKISGIYPSNETDALYSEAVVDSWRDTLDLYYDCFFERKVLGKRLQMVPRKKAERSPRFKMLLESELGIQFSRFEQLVAKNNGHVCQKNVNDLPGWADLAIYDLVKTIEGVMTSDQFETLMSDKTMLTNLVENIESLPSIQEHLQKYPYKDLSEFFATVP